jgi:hypothetical protein
MLKLKWSRNLSKILYWSWSTLFFVNCPKGDTHAITIEGKIFYNNLKWAWKISDLELFIPIASNKNVRKSNKNLKAMLRQLKPNSLKRLLQ